MIDTNKVIYEQADEKVWYVEIIRFEAPGSPIYKAIPAWYLRSYKFSENKIMHIVTMESSITTTVVRHIPSSRIFDTEAEALHFIEDLYAGRKKYER